MLVPKTENLKGKTYKILKKLIFILKLSHLDRLNLRYKLQTTTPMLCTRISLIKIVCLKSHITLFTFWLIVFTFIFLRNH